MNQQVVGVKDSICVPVLLRPTLGFLVVLTALSIGIYSSWGIDATTVAEALRLVPQWSFFGEHDHLIVGAVINKLERRRFWKRGPQICGKTCGVHPELDYRGKHSCRAADA